MKAVQLKYKPDTDERQAECPNTENTEVLISDIQIMEGGIVGEHNYKITFNSSRKIPTDIMGDIVKKCINFIVESHQLNTQE